MPVLLVPWFEFHIRPDRTGQGTVRTIYFSILITHILLAVLVPILAVAMFVLAFRGQWAAHRRFFGCA